MYEDKKRPLKTVPSVARQKYKKSQNKSVANQFAISWTMTTKYVNINKGKPGNSSCKDAFHDIEKQ